MTEHSTSLGRATTRTADGWPRIAWTHHDLDRMVEAGLLSREDRVELIGGEVIPMSPKDNRHERVRHLLVDWMYRRLPGGLRLLAEPGWRPAPEAYLEPDILIVPAPCKDMNFAGADVLLAVEIAETSLAYDTGIKRDRYAGLGVAEYWVINALDLTTRSYREPGPEGYPPPIEVAPSLQLTPFRVPEIAVRLADLDID